MHERLLLCTDLDRTLIPNGPQPESPQARELFAALVAKPGVVLVFVTGRHRQLVEEALEWYRLPQPDFVIGDVGTTIYRIDQDGNWRPDEDWEAFISQDWNGKTNRELQQLLSSITTLRPQESGKQNSYKLSYYVALDINRDRTAEAINRQLQSQSVRARLIWSVDEPAATGLLDILPGRASKYHAIAWLQTLLGFSDDDTVFSGDSGNDIEVLASPIPAVLVANSESAVRDQALREATAGGHSAKLYIARGGFKSMNGNYGAGILEGIAHYHPSLVSSLERGQPDERR
ncbi:MAG: HAD-IIB family hydrolase [Gammaproteobacteria bacterium]|nr:HAD-IIB family hydrolase [Gammaproteobacteria bacterium]